MGEIHFVDINSYTSQGLDFDKVSLADDHSSQTSDFNMSQLHNYMIECKETCTGSDYLNSCCNIDCTIYNEESKELGKFRGHIDCKDRFYKYEKSKESNLFESIKEHTVMLSNFFKIS